MIRLDKFLADRQAGTRSQLKLKIRNGQVSVNGCVVTDAARKVEEEKDLITLEGNPVRREKHRYFMLYKPAGVVTATRDNRHRTVLDCLGQDVGRDLFPVGRLDLDTEGLLLLTDDGELAHRLLAPGKKVPKTYEARLDAPLGEEAAAALEQGVDIGEKRLTAPASVRLLSQEQILLTITEGKYHQVKRMLQAVGRSVVGLKRVSMGSLRLDEGLGPGGSRELTEAEIKALKECCQENAGIIETD